MVSGASIITVPVRLEMANALAHRVKSAMGIEPLVLCDEELRGVAFNTYRAYDHLAKYDFGLFLTDDVALCQGFEYGVWSTTRVAKSRLRDNFAISYCEMTRHSEDALDTGYRWMVGDCVYDYAWVTSRRHWQGLAEFSRERDHPHPDQLACVYFRRSGVPVYQPLPCMADHALPGSSTLGHANKNRVARRSVASATDGKNTAWDYDWTVGFDTPYKRPFFTALSSIDLKYPKREGA